jgi:hypothetical protein
MSIVVNGEYVNTDKIQGILDLDEFSLDYGVQVCPEEMLTLANVIGQYNEYTPELATRLVREINALIPPMNFQPGNVNNGRTHHHFKVGREGSRVLYLEIYKGYLPKDFDYAKLTAKLDLLAKAALADEHWATENSETAFTYRMWWD